MVKKKDYLTFGIELKRASLDSDEAIEILNNYNKKDLENVLYTFSVANIPINQIIALISSKNNFFSCDLFKIKDEEKKYVACKEILCDLLFPITLISPIISLYILKKDFDEKEINLTKNILNAIKFDEALIHSIESIIKERLL